MKATSIQIGRTYEVKAGRSTTVIKVKSFNRKTGGWVCETKSGNTIPIKDPVRFVREVGAMNDTKTSKGKKTTSAKHERGNGGKPLGKLSGLDAAYKVLKEAKRPMRIREIAEIALHNKYCALNGATPEFTISAAMQREIAKLGAASRFVKAERGLFAAR